MMGDLCGEKELSLGALHLTMLKLRVVLISEYLYHKFEYPSYFDEFGSLTSLIIFLFYTGTNCTYF